MAALNSAIQAFEPPPPPPPGPNGVNKHELYNEFKNIKSFHKIERTNTKFLLNQDLWSIPTTEVQRQRCYKCFNTERIKSIPLISL